MTDDKAYRTELSPVSFLRRSAYVFPDKVAVVHGERRLTYREFDARVNRFASALVAAGVQPGDRVAFLAPNIPALLEAHYGVPAAGAVLVTINTRLAGDEVAYILEHSGARMLFVDRELEHLVEAATLPTIRINYTSGTTGRPKGVMYTYRGAYLNALVEALQCQLRPESVLLWVVPMFHCNGWCFPWAVAAMGGRQVCLRKLHPEAVWDAMERERITHYNGAPTVNTEVVANPAAQRLDREVTVTIGGAPPSPTLLAKMVALNFKPVHVYGLTETYAPYTVCEPQPDWAELPDVERAQLLRRQGVHNIVADQ